MIEHIMFIKKISDYKIKTSREVSPQNKRVYNLVNDLKEITDYLGKYIYYK